MGDAGTSFGENSAGSEFSGSVIHPPGSLRLGSRTLAWSGEREGDDRPSSTSYIALITVQHTFANHAAAQIARRLQSTTAVEVL